MSLPLSVWYDVVEEMRKRLEGAATHVVAYGHVGDGKNHDSLFENIINPLFCISAFAYIYMLLKWFHVKERVCFKHEKNLSLNIKKEKTCDFR